jgi:hypothetical protein
MPHSEQPKTLQKNFKHEFKGQGGVFFFTRHSEGVDLLFLVPKGTVRLTYGMSDAAEPWWDMAVIAIVLVCFFGPPRSFPKHDHDVHHTSPCGGHTAGDVHTRFCSWDRLPDPSWSRHRRPRRSLLATEHSAPGYLRFQPQSRRIQGLS